MVGAPQSVGNIGCQTAYTRRSSLRDFNNDSTAEAPRRHLPQVGASKTTIRVFPDSRLNSCRNASSEFASSVESSGWPVGVSCVANRNHVSEEVVATSANSKVHRYLFILTTLWKPVCKNARQYPREEDDS